MGFFSDLEDAEGSVSQQKSGSGFFGDLSEEPSRTRSVLSAFPKGILKSYESIQSMHDPIGSFISSLGGKSPNKQLEEKAIERFLPTQKGKFIEDVLETAGENAPFFALGPESLATKGLQIGSSALAKQGLKRMGAPELAQDIGGGIAAVAPQGIAGALSKKIIPSSAQKEAYELLKNYGFSDKTITPFIQNKHKLNILSKFSKPFLSKQNIKKDLSTISEKIYQDLLNQGEKLPPLQGMRKTAFLQNLQKEENKIPSFHRKLIQDEIEKIKNSPINYKSLRDFELSINNKIKSTEGGKEVLGILKEPINLGQRLISPEIYQKKQIMNKIYKSGKDFQKKISSDVSDKLLKAGEMGTLITGLLTLNIPLISKVGIKKGSELALSKFLTSPRLQSMRSKLLQSIKNDNQSATINLTSKIMEGINRYLSHRKVNSEESTSSSEESSS